MVPHNSDSDGHSTTVSPPAAVPKCAFRRPTDANRCPLGEVALGAEGIAYCRARHSPGRCSPSERAVAGRSPDRCCTRPRGLIGGTTKRHPSSTRQGQWVAAGATSRSRELLLFSMIEGSKKELL